MSYNIKVTAFGNGEVEFAVYKPGVYQRIEGETAYMQDIMSANDILYKDDAKYEYNPFTDKIQRVITPEDAAYEERKKEHSLMTSLNRTRNALYDYSRQCRWQWFVTLTYSPELVDRYDFSGCMVKARKWFMNQRNRKAPALKYVIVPEQHKDGAWHVHGVLCDTGNMEFSDSGRRHKGQVIYNLAGWKYGFSTATAVTDTYKVSAYIVKYITKDLCSITAGKQRYYASKSIPKPEVITDLVDLSEVNSYIQTIADSLGVDFERQKSISGYLDIDYKYYKVKES